MVTPKSNNRTLIFIFVVVLLDLLGLSLLIPVTPYIVREFRTDAMTVALLTVVYSAAQFFAAPLLGRLSDRVGRKPVLLVCLVGSAVGYVIFGIGGALWVLFLSRLIDGITGGNISVATASIADITPPADRAKNFALIGAAFGLGFVLGPALSGALVQISLSAPAYAAGALSLLSAIVGFFILPESLPLDQRNHKPLVLADVNPLGPTTELLRRPVLGLLIVGIFIFNFTFSAYVVNVVVYFINRFNVEANTIATLLVVGGVVRILMFPVIGWLVKIFGEKKLAVTGLMLQALTLLGVAFLPVFWMQYFITVLGSVGSALIFSNMGALASNQVPLSEQGKIAGVNTALGGLANIVGPLWAGFAYDFISPIAPYVSGAILLVATAVLVLQLKFTPKPLNQVAVQGASE